MENILNVKDSAYDYYVVFLQTLTHAWCDFYARYKTHAELFLRQWGKVNFKGVVKIKSTLPIIRWRIFRCSMITYWVQLSIYCLLDSEVHMNFAALTLKC